MLTTREPFRKYCSPEDFDKIREYDTVSEMWTHCIESYADDVAIEDNGRKFTYADIDADISRFRPLVRSEGRKRIGVYCINSYEFVKAYLSVVTAGLCAVIIPPQLDSKTLFGCTMKFSLDALVYSSELEEKLDVIKSQRPDFPLINAAEESDKTADIVIPDTKAPCVIMFTGGTTGKSKGALLSNCAVMQGTVNGCYGFDAVFKQRYLLLLPLSHVFGLIRNLMTSLYTGSDMYICRNNKDMFKDIAVFRPTILVLVPALAEMAFNLSKKFGRNMLGDSLKYIICGAAAVSPYLITEYKKQFDINLLAGYGLTESANLVSGNGESLDNPESVGPPYPNQKLKVENGELLIKGKNLMDGYVGEEEEAFTEDGYFRTGDLVKIDENGFIYITGRIKEIIVLPSGENISPAEVEARFNELDIIQDSQVFEDINESGAHILALEVVPRMTVIENLGVEDVPSYILQKLKEVNDSLLPYERVQRMEIRDSDFERTPSMKIKRYKKC